MVNWATALNCKRCAFLFETGETMVVAQTETTAVQSMPDTIGQPAYAESSYVSNNAGTHYRTPVVQPEIGWGGGRQNGRQSEGQYHAPYDQQPNNRQYQQNYGQQNYGQNYYQPNYAPHSPAGNQKIGMAVTSMILGVLAILTTFIAVGILLAPIGLILGIVALVKANKKPQQYGGKGFAIAGIATSGLITIMIPIVLAVAIPNVFAARRAANESSAVTVMQTIANAETKYRKNSNGYCADLNTLISSNLVEGKLDKPEKNGYRFNIVNYPLGGCEVTATPLSTSHGDRSFYFSTDDSLIRWAKKNGRPADKNDRLLTDSDEPSGASGDKPRSMLAAPVEGAAISTLRTLQGAQATYLATSGGGKCCADMQTLATLGLIKPDLADGEDAGYRFQFTKTTGENYEITATPTSTSFGSRSFFISPLDGLRGAAKNGLTADKHDPPVE